MISKDQTRANAQFYMKTRKGKITEKERGFRYNSEKITMVIASSNVLRFLGLIDRPPLSMEGISYLNKWVSLYRITEFSSY